MKLIKFLFQNSSTVKIGALFILGSCTGVISTSIIYLINDFIDDVQSVTIENSILYFSLIILYVAVSVAFFRGLIKISERMIKEIKEKIFQKILNSDYLNLMKHKDLVYTTLSSDINLIAESLIHMVYIVVSLSTIICCFIYMSILSWKLLLATILVFLSAVLVFALILRVAHPKLKKSRDIQDDIISVLNEILNGYKELLMYPLKRRALKEMTHKYLDDSYDNRVSAYSGLSVAGILGESFSFVFLGVLLLFFPIYFPEERGVVINFALTFLFVLKPIEVLSSLIGNLSNAEISTQKISKILTSFVVNKKEETKQLSSVVNFDTISIKELTYEYDSDSSFKIGPIDIDIKKNEIIFIHGGNGSGKTTFVNTLLGIYSPKNINVTILDRLYKTIEWSNLSKSLFAPVFSDFHLFEKNYGIQKNKENKVSNLLKLFEIDHKVVYDDAVGFSTIDLSLGQRKRLALIYAILEDRPILVLDEWAADQDPVFRKKFYLEILPFLVKNEDKTIIAITHDDSYYEYCDNLYKMDYGSLKINKGFPKTEETTLFNLEES
ncbi:ATP-binding cassette domain-containing protein [Aquimarina hainanensis]|uniref:ATP-binding cassette domain-containing protein n=1 Tax=Aquimarina hainanensis TaxID=1578017 RepID=A0ABW5N5A2_9FLAO|nr:ATP-binding cassette domain-containing protein [Aquimarina sp. TRL1]QKX04219.1 ATP-binding cassette domain-containing protein [Aquimarina sp. TRL1]